MPISQINPDGTVKIYNKETGQIKDVKPEELSSYNPALVGDYQKMAQEKQRVADTVENVRGGVTTAPSGTGDFDVAVNNELRKLGHKNLSETERTVKDQASVLEKDIELFEKNFKEAGLRGKFVGLLPSGTGLSPESADFDSMRDTLAYSLAGALAQQKGQGVSNKDFEKFKKLLPARSNTDTEAKNKMDNIRTMLSTRTQNETQPSSIEGGDGQNIIQKGMNALLGSSINTAKDIGTGLALNQQMPEIQKSTDELMYQADQLDKKGMVSKDPEERKKLFGMAKEARDSAAKTTTDLTGNFSEDVEMNPLLRGALAGTEIAGGASLAKMGGNAVLKKQMPDIVGGVVNKAKGLKEAMPSISTKGAAETRDAVAKEVSQTFDGNTILKAADDYVANDPTAKNLLKQIRPTLENQQIGAPQLLEKIKIWGQAYKDAGGLKETSKANLYDKLSKAARSEIETKAPELSKAHKEFAKVVGRNSNIKNMANRITYGLPAAAATTVLGIMIYNAMQGED